MKLIDTHCHINLDDFKNDFEELLSRIEDKLEFVINVGYDLKTSEESVNLSNKYGFIYATVGIHPHDSKTYNTLVKERLIELVKNNNKVLAIGEIGLDYYRNYSPKEIQKKFLKSN
ncbi:MAG: TatD DNase family protein [Fusobacteriaceae bacterium]|jgi:TatD DNase family protein|nr:sec-independent protein TatD [Fusobacteriales bacterium]MDN5304892.1 TatD DNase family protein [Fusobacteriaceae bacterium]